MNIHLLGAGVEYYDLSNCLDIKLAGGGLVIVNLHCQFEWIKNHLGDW
jgi:hypothetical protein